MSTSLTKMLRFLLFVVFLVQIESAKILFVALSPSLSHNLFYQPIIRELCARGHQVTSIASDIIDDKNIENLTEISVHAETYGKINVGDYLIEVQKTKPRLVTLWRQLMPMSKELLERVITKPEVQNVLKNGQFDLLILEYFTLPIISAWKEHFKCPAVGVASTELLAPSYLSLGNPIFSSYYVDINKASGLHLSFYQRLENFLYMIDIWKFYYDEAVPMQQEIYDKHFFPSVDLQNADTNVDLVLMNSNNIFHIPRPLVPTLIQIGGLHVRERKPLPQELQLYLDSCKKGVVYFSLGSNVKSKNLPKAKFDAIVGAFKRLPYQVLWKWEDEDLANKPQNVHTRKWLPQQDVLDHPNIKAFVSQCGIQSLEEAIRSKVPVVCIPFGGDQDFNAERIEALKVGTRLDFSDLTADTLVNNLLEVLENSMYQTEINKVSDLLWDQPMKPMDKAIWWIEYVIRHKGAQHLRTPAADMHWFILFSLDVICFLLGIGILGLLVLFFMIRCIIKTFCKKNVQKLKNN